MNNERLRLVYDTESDGLRHEATRIWCVVAKCIDSGDVYQFGPDGISDAVELLGRATELICHNQIDHDLPLLRRLTGFVPNKKCNVVDTLVLSRAIWPDREPPSGYKGKAPHSVEAYGIKFGRFKPEHEDWSRYSDKMLHRCTEDVHIQHRIYDHLLTERKRYNFPDFSWRLEHLVAEQITQQEINGVPFDVDKAKEIIQFINDKQKGQEEHVRRLLGYALGPNSSEKDINDRKISIPFTKKTGEPSKKLLKLWPDAPLEQISGPFTYIDQKLSSRQQIIDQLLDLGWKPREDEWNFKKDPKGKPVKDQDGNFIKTNPQLSNKGKPVDSLLKIENDAGQAIALWYILAHRKGVIEGWIKQVREDGRLPAGANPCGANTARMKHRVV